MRKVLVIRFSSLGDIILTTPLYKNLKMAWKDCHIAVATKEKYADVFKGNPFIDEFITLKEGESIFSLIGRVRQSNFDVLIDLHNNLRSNLLSLFSNIPKKVRYRKAVWERRAFVAQKRKDPELARHTIDRYLETLKPLGITPVFFAPEIRVENLPSGVEEKKSLAFRLLVVQTAYLGDAVLTTPMFEAIRKVYPSSKITVLCTPEIKEVFTENKNIDQLLVMDKRGKEKGVFSLFRWGKKLAGEFDAAVLPHRSFRSAFLVWLAKVPKRIGFDNSQGKIFLTDTVHFDWEVHDAERNVKLLEALGIKGVRPKVELSFSSGSFDFQEFLSKHQINNNTELIGINAGSVWKTKRWLPERFAEVADRLIEERNGKVLLFGAKHDFDSVATVIRSMKHTAINLCDKTDLKTLTYLISRCSLFVTNDSGPMHLACAVGVPVVAVFGPTTKELGFFPYSEKSVVVERELSCRPCTLHGGEKCPLEHFKCMREITTEMVLEPCRKFLAESKGSSR